MAEFISAPLALAAEQFAKLPGIGIKTAQRLAYYMLNLPPHEVKEFADALVRARNAAAARTSPTGRSARYAPTSSATSR